MPYEDYIKFSEIAKSELPSNYAIWGYLKPRHFQPHYALRLHNIDTTCFSIYTRENDLRMGIHIDILIMNGIPDEKFYHRKIVLTLMELYRKLNVKLRYPLPSFTRVLTSGSLLRILARIIFYAAFIPIRLLLPYYYFALKQENMLKRYKFESSDKIIFTWRDTMPNQDGWYKMIFFYDDFRDSIELPFEDTTISVPIGYERYLTMDYGDYNTLPPEEKRVPSFSSGLFVVDLDKPYTYYDVEKAQDSKC